MSVRMLQLTVECRSSGCAWIARPHLTHQQSSPVILRCARCATRTRSHAHSDTRTHVRAHTHTHSFTHTPHAHTHARTHGHTRTSTHARTCRLHLHHRQQWPCQPAAHVLTQPHAPRRHRYPRGARRHVLARTQLLPDRAVRVHHGGQRRCAPPEEADAAGWPGRWRDVTRLWAAGVDGDAQVAAGRQQGRVPGVQRHQRAVR